MQNISRIAISFLVIVHIILALPFSVSADDADYERNIKAGVEEFDRGNYEEANVFFREAHRINPNARTLRAMGMAAFELRQYVHASKASRNN